MVRNAIERPISHKVLARGSYWEGRGGGGGGGSRLTDIKISFSRIKKVRK